MLFGDSLVFSWPAPILGPIPSPKTSRRTSFWRPASARAAPGRSISKDGLDRSGSVWIGLASCPIIPRFVGILGACCPWIAAAWLGSRGCTPFLSSSLLGMWCRCYQPEVQWMNKKGSTQHAIVRMLAGSMRGYFSLFTHHGGILPEFETGSQDEHGTLHNCTVQERPSNNSMPKVLQVFSVDNFSIDDPPWMRESIWCGDFATKPTARS